MSVTFWMPQAPVFRHQPYADEPDYFQTDPVAPFTEVNMANSNARAILDLVMPGFDHTEPFGEWDAEKLALVQRNCMRALNSRTRREPAHLEATQEGNWYSGGRDDEYVTTRIGQLLEMVKVAQEHGFIVVYG